MRWHHPDSDAAERSAAELIAHLVRKEHIEPRQIGVVTMGGKGAVVDEFVKRLRGAHLPADASEAASDGIYVDTPHSFKGHERDVIVVPCLNRLMVQGQPAASFRNAHVAFTRARELPFVFGAQSPHPGELVEAARAVSVVQRDRGETTCGVGRR